jgi:SPP1 gp7 family putative phage head morphogenesis protein
MRRVEPPIKEQYNLLHHSSKLFTLAIDKLVKAKLSNNMFKEEKALLELSRLIGDSNVLANLLGRRRLLLEFEKFKERAQPKPDMILFEDTPVVPYVDFVGAVKDLLSRPVYGEELKLGFEAARDMYLGRSSFAMAKTIDGILTKKVQGVIADSMFKGLPIPEASEIIAEMGDWSTAYAQTVYRTNLTQSYTTGRFEQAKSPNVSRVIGAFQYTSLNDRETRANHRAADGLIASIHDPIWNTLKPPLGFQCRCQVVMVDKFTLDRAGLIATNGDVTRGWMLSSGSITKTPPGRFAFAGPDPKFRSG